MSLTLEDKIGQMLLFGWQGGTAADAHTVSGHALRLIEQYRVGGIILMARNVGPPDDIRSLISELQSIAASAGLPRLLVATDQEGGRVARFGPPHYSAYPTARSIGAAHDADQARKNASEIGRVLRDVGVNWALMPVLDVNNNPRNEVIGDRSFGDDPDLVSLMGAASVMGMQDDASVMACGKHFPGHGDTHVDSHIDLPTIDRSLDRLRQLELKPFRAAIEAGIGSIMTSHILFKQLDDILPATLSQAILTDLLRPEMGFDGVVVTDCLEMKGVDTGWGSAEAAILAAIAGADMLLVCHTEHTQRKVRQALLEAVRTSRLPESRIDEANERILRAKSSWA